MIKFTFLTKEQCFGKNKIDIIKNQRLNYKKYTTYADKSVFRRIKDRQLLY